MLVEWLKPVIEMKCDELSDLLLDQNCSSEYTVFLSILKSNPLLSNEVKYELENLFIMHSKRAVDVSYKSGLTEGIQIFRKDG